MSFVIGKCRRNPEKYCKNWNGKGDTNSFVDVSGVFEGQCPTSKEQCEFLVTPKPSPKLKAS